MSALRPIHLWILNGIVLFAGLIVTRSVQTDRDTWPDGPIRLIVPFGAGGGTDTFARIFERAIRENELLPTPLVIINVDGAGGTIGSRRVRDARPDGNTIMILHEALMTARAFGTAPYGSEQFEPIAATGEIQTLVAVPDDSRFRSLTDLLDEAVSQPDTIRFAANMGALTHAVGLQLEHLRPDARFRFAQFGGGAERLSGLLGGHCDLTGFTVEEFIKFRPKGLRALAVFSEQRHAAILDVPTAREQGVDFVNSNTFYWWAPKGTPHERLDIMADVLRRAMATDYVQDRMRTTQFNPLFVTGQDLCDRIQRSAADADSISTRPPQQLPNLPLGVGLVTLTLIAMVVLQSTLQRQPPDAVDPIAAGSATAGRSASDSPSPELEPLSPEQLPPVNVFTATDQPRSFTAVLLTIMYIVLLSFDQVTFVPVTIAFVALKGFVLTGCRLTRIPGILLVAQLVGFGLDLLFSQLLMIELP